MRFLNFVMPFLALAVLPIGAQAAAQEFELTKGETINAGEPVEIRLTGLPPETDVEIEARRVLKSYYRRGMPRLAYRSAATFRSDADGVIDLARTPAQSGSYEGTDAAGLFWSMTPVSDESVSPDDTVLLEAFIDQRSVASSSFEMPFERASFRVEEMPGLPGSYFAAAEGQSDSPVIILVDGADSLGDSREVVMPQLVAQGYSVLHFATFELVYGPGKPTVEGLPGQYVDIPIDRLQEARDWLAAQPGVDEDRIGLYGYSRNAAFVLLAATYFDWVKAVAAIAPSDVVYEGWGPGVELGTTSSYSWMGEPLAYVPYADNYFEETAKLARGQKARLRTPMDEGRWANLDRIAPARIRVERYTGPLLVAGGERDDVWAAGKAAQSIAERRAEHGLETELLVFPFAGHGLFANGWTPTFLFEQGEARAIEARAQDRSWRATKAFFEEHLLRGHEQ